MSSVPLRREESGSADNPRGATATGQPRQVLGLHQTVAIIVGIVIGAGIFKAPSLVAGMAGSTAWMFVAWVLGGVMSLIGALCYAELATAFPSAGGDYHFLRRAYGPRVSFLFAWARFSVITTGSIALLAFVFGDYMTQVVPLARQRHPLRGRAVLVLSWINLRGIGSGAAAQTWLTLLEVGGLLLIVVAGLLPGVGGGGAAAGAARSAPAAAGGGHADRLVVFGMAMVFVLLTYGGWNEAAYISAEVKGGSRNMVRRAGVVDLLITGALPGRQLGLLARSRHRRHGQVRKRSRPTCCRWRSARPGSG